VPIRFDTDAWTRNRSTRDAHEWSDALGDTLRLEVVSRPAPYLTAAADLAALREWCRLNAARRNGGIVSADLVEVGGGDMDRMAEAWQRADRVDNASKMSARLS